jgi:ABC-type microcin C transport system permease subunit YejE
MDSNNNNMNNTAIEKSSYLSLYLLCILSYSVILTLILREDKIIVVLYEGSDLLLHISYYDELSIQLLF